MDDPSDETPPEPEPAPAKPIRGIVVSAAGLLTAAVAAVAVIWWSPWVGNSCADDDEHVIDEESKLCYAIPEGWAPLSESELAEEAELTGLDAYTSGLSSPEEHVAWVDVAPATHFVLGDIEEDDLESLAEALATSSEAMSSGEPEIETETMKIGDHRAATATAHRPNEMFGADANGWVQWVRATIVDVGDGASVLMTTALVEEEQMDDEDGTVAILNGIHDSLAVR